MSDDEYEPLVFPRDVWPQETYFYPGLHNSGLPEDRVRFAAQQASRKLTQALSNLTFAEDIDEIDFTFAVLDVVLQL